MAPPQGSSAGAYGQQAPQPVVVSSYSYHAQPMKPTAVLAGKPTLIQWDRLRFLIMDAPRVRTSGRFVWWLFGHVISTNTPNPNPPKTRTPTWCSTSGRRARTT